MAESVTALEETLHKIASENKFVDYNVKIKLISSDGANYSSQLYLATISNTNRNLNLFAKVIFLGDKFRAQGLIDMIDIEPFVYTTLHNMYRQLEEKHNVAKEHRLEFSKYFGQNPTRGQEVLVLEDLSARGYSVYDRFKSVNWPYASEAVKEMAKLHALSFAFEHEHPKEFKIAKDKCKFNTIMEKNVSVLMTMALEKAYSVIEGKNLQKVQNFFEKLEFTNSTEYMKPLRRGVLAHGDFRMSNLMYKVNEDGLYQIMILDYQTMYTGSPVADLLYFIFTGTNEEFRSKHYLPLLDHYYTQLSLAMCRLGLNPSKIYSREDFDYELEQKLPYGLVIAVVSLPLVLVEVKDAPVMDEDSDFSAFLSSKSGKLYPERLNGIINDFVRWRVL